MTLDNRTRAIVWTIFALIWCADGIIFWIRGSVLGAGSSAVVAALFLAVALGYAHRNAP